MISLRLDPAVEKLRQEFLKWLGSNPPPNLRPRAELDEFVEVSSKWQRVLAEGRWIGVHWPEEFGGRGLSLVEEAVLQETLAHKGSPQLVGLFGLTMVGPVLIKHGTPKQKKLFLQKILRADEIWCQGFSEPGAGSDLAAVATSARREHEKWIISGQKVWTSFAQYAAWCFALVRTDGAAERHKGLSYLLVPMSSEGISVRPLEQITRDKEFNEVFFDNVAVRDEFLVGAPGQGWEIAISTLMYERVILTFARHLQSEQMLAELRELVRARAKSDPSLLERFGRLVSHSMAVRALALSHLVHYSKGESQTPGPEGSLDKLGWSENFQEICAFALELLGQEGLITDGENAVKEGFFPHQYLYSRGRTIAAGTSEIQRNIIAERLLGLGRER